MLKQLNHIGIAVRDLEQVRSLCTSVFKADFPAPKANEGSDFKASWVQLGDVKVEFMEPITSGVIAKFLDRRGQGMQHLCFEVDDIEAEVKSYLANGLELVAPGIKGRPGWRTAFFHPKSTFGILIELVQTKIPQGTGNEEVR